MKETHFYIFRHGETDFNKEGYFQGQGIDLPLNSHGKAQAKELVLALKDIPIEIVISSPLIRAEATGSYIAKDKNISLEIEDDLKEGNFGIAEGWKKDKFAKEFPEEYERWRSLSLMDFALPGGETRNKILFRAFRVLNKMLKTPYSHIAVATHAGVLRAILIKFGIKQDYIPNAGFFHIVHDGKGWSIC
jgi:broad specificity phosphatase PhoE